MIQLDDSLKLKYVYQGLLVLEINELEHYKALY